MVSFFIHIPTSLFPLSIFSAAFNSVDCIMETPTVFATLLLASPVSSKSETCLFNFLEDIPPPTDKTTFEEVY